MPIRLLVLSTECSATVSDCSVLLSEDFSDANGTGIFYDLGAAVAAERAHFTFWSASTCGLSLVQKRAKFSLVPGFICVMKCFHLARS